MKKLIPFILILALALSMTACNSAAEVEESSEPVSSQETVEESADTSEESSEEVSEKPSEEPSEEESKEEESSAADTPADENTVITEVEVTEITKDQVLDAYKSCVAFRDYWFRGGNSDAMTDETVDIDGVTYWRYESDDISTYAEFEAAALSLVSREIFAAWQENYTYIDCKGQLYGPMNYGSGDQDGFSHIEAECVKLSPEEYELKVGEYYFAEYITGEEGTLLTGEYTCSYEFQDGGWVFTSFAYTPVSNFAG